MKFFDKLGLTLFSAMILIVSIVLCAVAFGWIDVYIISDSLDSILSDTVSTNIFLGVLIILIILSIKCIFFNSYSREEMKNKEGILLENDNGKLLISRDTIENLANTVVKSFDSAESVMTKVDIDNETSLKIFITLFVYPDAVIKELTRKLQTDVKTAVKKSLDLEVKEVNVRIRNISAKKEPTIKE